MSGLIRKQTHEQSVESFLDNVESERLRDHSDALIISIEVLNRWWDFGDGIVTGSYEATRVAGSEVSYEMAWAVCSRYTACVSGK